MKNELQHTHEAQRVSAALRGFLQALPPELQEKARLHEHIKTTYDQFAQVVEDVILQHVNSVYLVRDAVVDGADYVSQDANQATSQEILPDQQISKQPNTKVVSSVAPTRTLTVYVDNSLIAAELNARRELIKLKYREKFNIVISEFDIRISRMRYKDHYPYREQQSTTDQPQHFLDGALTSRASYEEIYAKINEIENPKIRNSYKELLAAYARKSDFLQQKQPKSE